MLGGGGAFPGNMERWAGMLRVLLSGSGWRGGTGGRAFSSWRRHRPQAGLLSAAELVNEWTAVFEKEGIPEARESSEYIVAHVLGAKTVKCSVVVGGGTRGRRGRKDLGEETCRFCCPPESADLRVMWFFWVTAFGKYLFTHPANSHHVCQAGGSEMTVVASVGPTGIVHTRNLGQGLWARAASHSQSPWDSFRA